jgi:transglutaminase-like putative cysteine protease
MDESVGDQNGVPTPARWRVATGGPERALILRLANQVPGGTDYTGRPSGFPPGLSLRLDTAGAVPVLTPPFSHQPLRLGFSIALQYDVAAPGADFIFNVQPAQTRQQHLVHERLTLNQAILPQAHMDSVSRSQYVRLQAWPGTLTLNYRAVVDLFHHQADPMELGEIPVMQLPPAVLGFLCPSRYCESDRLQALAMAQFGQVSPGYQRVVAIRDWVRTQLRFEANTSDSTTSACDSLNRGAGVCRDFAHVMIGLCRALNIPARFATGFDYGADPALGPPDFHAYVEVYVGHRWYLFDPSGTAIPMSFVRLATGRDASDAAFAMIFGSVTCYAPIIHVAPQPNAQGILVTPEHTWRALSTDGMASLAQ